MLRLRQEIERERCCVRVARRDRDELARALERVDTDVRGYEPLRRGGVRVAGSDDLVDAGERSRAVCERGDPRGTSGAVERVRVDERERVRERRVDLARARER